MGTLGTLVDVWAIKVAKCVRAEYNTLHTVRL
jgi:hypothetical protein